MGVVSNVIKTLKRGISGGKKVFNSAYGYYNRPKIRDSCISLDHSHICSNDNNSLNS